MKNILVAISFSALISLGSFAIAFAQSEKDSMVEDTDGILTENEYTKISPNGGITRRPCPYTCEMRGVPKEHCKEWTGVDSSAKVPECYVHDLRLPSDAIKFSDAAK